jgi:hypothetical protein
VALYPGYKASRDMGPEDLEPQVAYVRALCRTLRAPLYEAETYEADDLLEAMEIEVRRRRFGRAVRLEVSDDMSAEALELLTEELEVGPDDVYRLDAPVDLTGLFSVYDLDKEEHVYNFLWPISQFDYGEKDYRIFPVFWEHPAVQGITLWGWRVGHWRTAQGDYIVNDDGGERFLNFAARALREEQRNEAERSHARRNQHRTQTNHASTLDRVLHGHALATKLIDERHHHQAIQHRHTKQCNKTHACRNGEVHVPQPKRKYPPDSRHRDCSIYQQGLFYGMKRKIKQDEDQQQRDRHCN